MPPELERAICCEHKKVEVHVLNPAAILPVCIAPMLAPILHQCSCLHLDTILVGGVMYVLVRSAFGCI